MGDDRETPSTGRVGRGQRATLRIRAFTLVSAAVALFLLAKVNAGGTAEGFFSPWWGVLALAVLFAVSELMVVHFQVGRSAHTMSVIEATFVIALFHATPTVAFTAQVVGCGVVLVVHRHQRSTKLLFNLAMFALENQLAFAVFRALTSNSNRDSMPSPGDWPAAFAAAGSFTVVGAVLVFVVIYLAEDSPVFRDVLNTIRVSLLTSVVMASVGIAAATLLELSPATALLFAVPIVGLYVTNQTFVRAQRRSEELEFLRGASARLLGEDLAEQTLWAVLEAARAEFRVELIQFDYLSTDDSSWRRVSFRRGQPPSSVVVEDPALAGVCPSSALLITNASTSADALSKEIAAREIGEDVLVAPVRVRGDISGVLVVAQPSTEVVSFGTEDLRLAEMLATQLASAMENARLEQSVAEFRQLETKLVFELQHDPLTGLLNRASFARRVREVISRVHGNRTNAVVFIDLDDFKPINDVYGHAAGDQVLKTVGQRLLGSIRPHDLASRFGGDEFVVFVNPVASRDEAVEAANRLLSIIRQPVVIDDNQIVNPGASVGIAISSPDDTYEAILERADAAMFRAKKRGKGHVEVLDPTMDDAVRRAYELEIELHGALSRGELQLVYQSVHRLSTLAVVGYECLLRWSHPELGVLLPDKFMPTGLGADVQRAVRRFVCEQLSASASALTRVPDARTWSINLGAGQILDETLVEDLTTLAGQPDFGPGRLRVEIAEPAFSRSAESVIARTDALRQAGIGLIVDDLRIDGLNLSLLERANPVEVKLSQSLVRDLGHRRAASPFVRSVVELGRDVGFAVVAKGIEDSSTAQLAQELGCALGQGYLFARPATVDEISSQAALRRT